MPEFDTFLYSSRAYSSEEIISFSQSPRTHFSDIDKEMQFHRNAAHVQVSCLTQAEFDAFILNYANHYKSIYFFQNTLVKDLSALAHLQNAEYLLFYNVRANSLWDMSSNSQLKGIYISDSKKLCYDLSFLPTAPALEEVVLLSSAYSKYTVKSLEPLKSCKKLKRAMLECITEDGLFAPEDFSHLEAIKYRVNKYHNCKF